MSTEKQKIPTVFIRGFFTNPSLIEIQKKGTEKQKKRILDAIGCFYLNPLENYPVEYHILADEIVCEMIKGKYDPDVYYEFGRKGWDYFINSSLGKIASVFVGKNPEYFLLNGKKVFDIIGTGIEMSTEKVGPNQIKVRVFNDPFPLRTMEGILVRGMEFLNCKDSQVKFINHGKHDHEFILSWED